MGQKDFITDLHEYIDAQDKKYPMRVWIDKLFKNKSIAGYRASYSIARPWLIVEEWGRQVGWAWQRVFRGWDDRVIWSIDWHIAEMLPIWIRELKKDKCGIPSMFFKDGDDYVDPDGVVDIKPEAMERAKKEWDSVMESVAIGFESYLAREEYKFETKEEELELTKKFEKGFELWGKYFGAFWD
jgi:hypothetical protein